MRIFKDGNREDENVTIKSVEFKTVPRSLKVFVVVHDEEHFQHTNKLKKLEKEKIKISREDKKNDKKNRKRLNDTWDKFKKILHACKSLSNQIISIYNCTRHKGIDLIVDGIKYESLNGYVYAYLNKYFPDLKIPARIRNLLVNHAISTYNTATDDSKQNGQNGNIPRFKNSFIPITADSIKSIKKYSGTEYLQFIIEITPIRDSENKPIKLRTIIDKKHYYVRNYLESIMDGTYFVGDSKINMNSEDMVCLNLSIRVPKDESIFSVTEDRTLGIDLGCNVPVCGAIVSDDKKNGVSLFKGDAAEISHLVSKHKHMSRRKKSKDKKKNSKKGRNLALENRYHKISKDAIDFAVEHKIKVIALEDLTGIKEKIRETKPKVNKKDPRERKGVAEKNYYKSCCWSPTLLQSMIEYKAAKYNIAVVYVNPRNTSVTCRRCGHIDKNNRKTRNDFKCLECGYTSHADYNAAFNIGKLGKDVFNKHKDDILYELKIKKKPEEKKEDNNKVA